MALFIVTFLASAVAAALVWHFTSSWSWHWLFKIVAAVGAFMGTPYLLAALHIGIDKQQIMNFVTFVS
jgi:MFS family permease